MADKEPKGAPPVLPKSRRLERVERGARADTGGDMYDRFRGNYSKNPAPKDDSPFYLDNLLK